MKTITEAEVRALRDLVYGPCTDNNWAACRDGWMKPENIEWLRRQSRLVGPATKAPEGVAR